MCSPQVKLHALTHSLLPDLRQSQLAQERDAAAKRTQAAVDDAVRRTNAEAVVTLRIEVEKAKQHAKERNLQAVEALRKEHDAAVQVRLLLWFVHRLHSRPQSACVRVRLCHSVIVSSCLCVSLSASGCGC